MTARPRDIPDLFEDSALDPVETATGRRKPASTAPDPESRPAASTGKPSGATPKKKPDSIYPSMSCSGLPSNTTS